MSRKSEVQKLSGIERGSMKSVVRVTCKSVATQVSA